MTPLALALPDGALLQPLAYAEAGRVFVFDPSQPRAPAGGPEGGQWVSEEVESVGVAEGVEDEIDSVSLFRAHGSDEDLEKMHAWSSFSKTLSDAQAYQNNPGFGGPYLREVKIVGSEVLRLPLTGGGVVNLRELGKMMGLSDEGLENQVFRWKDDSKGGMYPWEGDAGLREWLKGYAKDNGYRYLRYLDDFPSENTETIVPIFDVHVRASKKAYHEFFTFDPNQPRAPAGTSEGGQWVSLGGVPEHLKEGTHENVGPVVLGAYRTGPLKDAFGRGIFFGDSPDSIKDYRGLHDGAEIVAYRIEARNAVVSESQASLFQHYFGKPLRDVQWQLEKRSGFKTTSPEAFREMEKRIAARARAKGHDVIIYTSPPAPAKVELAVVGKTARISTEQVFSVDDIVEFFDPQQPRDAHGRWTSTGEARGTTVSIRPARSGDRAFSGAQRALRRTLSKHEVGALSEAIGVAWLRANGFGDARALEFGRNNFPLDVIDDHKVFEVKGGLVSNRPDAQKWRLTIGEPGPSEKRWLAKASEAAKARYNERKMEAILARKTRAMKEVAERYGKRVKGGETLTVILDPDRGLADVFRFKGFHAALRWRGEEARAAYQGTVRWQEVRGLAFDPNQPRDPKGSPTGGQWASDAKAEYWSPKELQ